MSKKRNKAFVKHPANGEVGEGASVSIQGGGRM